MPLFPPNRSRFRYIVSAPWLTLLACVWLISKIAEDNFAWMHRWADEEFELAIRWTNRRKRR